MGERTSYAPGTFSWVDLQTSDPAAAKSFYGELFDWDYDDIPLGEGMAYSMARRDGRLVAAVSPPPPGDESPPHWNCYVSVESADATASRASQLGATVLAEPFDVFDAGRMAVINDPQGAVVSIWQPKENHGAELVNDIGALAWNDLITPDTAAATSFYGDLFGWTIEPTPEAEGQYWTIQNGEAMNGGMMPAPPGQHPAWNLYFGVEDAEATVSRVGELGGATVIEPMEVPGGGRFAIFSDPQGAVFSVVSGRFDL